MQKVTREILLAKAAELLSSGTVNRVLGWKAGEFTYDVTPAVFHTAEECRRMLTDGGVRILHEVASDGASELLADKINAMDEENYAGYLRWHWYICEKPEFLGMSNHLLFVGEI